MPEAKPSPPLSWVTKAAPVVIALAGLFLLGSPLLKQLSFGDTSIGVKAGFLKPGEAFDTEPSGFISTGWDGPTGEFSHGNIYGLKLGKWMYRLDVVTEPVVSARKKLPKTIPELLEALNSQEPFVHNAAALELSQRGLTLESSSTGYAVISSSNNVPKEIRVTE